MDSESFYIKHLNSIDIWKKVHYGITRISIKRYSWTTLMKKKCLSLGLAAIKRGLPILARYLHGYINKKVFVFIDEFDTPVNEMIHQHSMTISDRENTIILLQEIIKRLLKECEFVGRSVSNARQQLTGVLLASVSNISCYAFLRGHQYCEYYGFLEGEVDELLKRVEKPEYFEKIRENYNGYRIKLIDTDREISVYSPRAILEYLAQEQHDTYLAAGIFYDVQGAIGLPQIRSRILQISNEENNKIKYVRKLQIKHIKILSDIIRKKKMEPMHEDLFLQFLHEQGFFNLISWTHKTLQLTIPNRSVFNKIDEIVYNVNLKNTIYKEHINKVKKLCNTMYDLGISCTEENVHAVAERIKDMFSVKPSPVCDTDFQYRLYLAIRKEFSWAHTERKTFESRRGEKCDIVFMNDSCHAAFIIETKYLTTYAYHNCKAAHAQIFEKEYDTILNDARLKELFPDYEETIEKRIYLGIDMNEEFKVSITFSIDGREPAHTVSTEYAKVKQHTECQRK